MIYFGFIFLSRAWALDSAYFIRELRTIGERVKRQGKPLAFVLYPEGTLVSKGAVYVHEV
jgi:1-acyl-sn-glycerol-3-phosphate acyltransferase